VAACMGSAAGMFALQVAYTQRKGRVGRAARPGERGSKNSSLRSCRRQTLSFISHFVSLKQCQARLPVSTMCNGWHVHGRHALANAYRSPQCAMIATSMVFKRAQKPHQRTRRIRCIGERDAPDASANATHPMHRRTRRTRCVGERNAPDASANATHPMPVHTRITSVARARASAPPCRRGPACAGAAQCAGGAARTAAPIAAATWPRACSSA